VLTAEGCRGRRQRLLDRLTPSHPLLLGDPLNLRYLANFYVDPISLGADYGGLLLLQPDGRTTLYHDNRLPKSVAEAHADERVPVKWYDGKSPGDGPRRLILRDVVELSGTNGRIHDSLDDELAPDLWRTISELRRAKDPDEIEVLRACMRAGEAGQDWARRKVQPGLTELHAYSGVFHRCCRTVGRPVVVYGDFAVSPGPARRGGPPTDREIQAGDMLILDYSVVIQGYRSDFTNTLVVGADPTPEQQRLFDLCVAAMAEGEKLLRAGTACRDVYDAVRGAFDKEGMADHFPHHAGHGLGLAHPEAPFFVKDATETLIAGDVVTLEPGLYVENVGGVRIEHNYLITQDGYERLSNHTIALK
jgi:Xaa-Pro aminopeptidase